MPREERARRPLLGGDALGRGTQCTGPACRDDARMVGWWLSHTEDDDAPHGDPGISDRYVRGRECGGGSMGWTTRGPRSLVHALRDAGDRRWGDARGARRRPAASRSDST